MSSYCLVVNGDSYFSPFEHLGLKFTDDQSTIYDRPDKIGLVVFTGGADVSPSLYGHNNLKSYTNPLRDMEEVNIFNAAAENEIPMAGICRGAQFLCAMAGGHLVQDITNHTSSHRLSYKDKDGNIMDSPEPVTSTHHQMQYPWVMEDGSFDILAWSSRPRSLNYIYDGDGAIDKMEIEPDVVFYNDINALAIQYHPEYMSRNSWGFNFAKALVSEKLGHLVDNRKSLMVGKR